MAESSGHPYRHPGILVATAWDRFLWKSGNFVHHPPSDRAYESSLLAWLSALSGKAEAECTRALAEAPGPSLSAEIGSLLVERAASGLPEAGAPTGPWLTVVEALYALVRLTRPKILVETGVGIVGSSTAFTLAALAANGAGELWSIDLDRYFALYGRHVGQGIPDRLRERHHMLTGDARTILPGLLRELGQVDQFFHDGLHSYRNMRFEYSVAFPRLTRTGILLSDDLVNSALDDQVREWKTSAYFVRYSQNVFGGCRSSGVEPVEAD